MAANTAPPTALLLLPTPTSPTSPRTRFDLTLANALPSLADSVKNSGKSFVISPPKAIGPARSRLSPSSCMKPSSMKASIAPTEHIQPPPLLVILIYPIIILNLFSGFIQGSLLIEVESGIGYRSHQSPDV